MKEGWPRRCKASLQTAENMITCRAHATEALNHSESEQIMAKPHRPLKKANHGKRPANSKARRLKRRDIKT